MARKIKKIQIFRHIIQLIMFFVLPGMYAMAFSELKGVYQMLANGNFDLFQAFPGIIELITTIFMTVILGRFFCGWLCAFGAYNDLIHEISKNVFKIKYKVNAKVDSVLKYLKYIILIAIIVVTWIMGSSIFDSASPWDAFAQITNISEILSGLTIGFVLLVLITIGAAFIERFFCRYLCPLGAIFSIVSKINIFKIDKPNDKCGNCRACTNNCSMGIPLYKVNEVRGGECINCLKCVEVCPRRNTQASILDENINPTLASSVAIAAFAAVYGTNQLGSAVLANSGIASAASITSTTNANSNMQKYNDGTYTGTGEGFRGGTTKVSVTIKNGNVASIETLSEEDTPQFYARAERVIPNKIVSAQSTSVDTVSGATFSSRGIISAVQDALTQAAANAAASSVTDKANTQSKNESAANSTTNGGSSASESTVQKSKYKDGTYTGSAKGFRKGTTTVLVTISNGKIISIKTDLSQDTPQFYQRAERVIPDEIILAQSTSVDTVSGATFSSRGIIDAVADALSKAV